MSIENLSREVLEEKIQKTIDELKQWLDKSDTEEFYYLKSINCIKENISKETFPKSTIVYYKTMDNWFSNNFVYEMLVNQQSTYKTEASANGYHILIASDKFAKIYADNPPKLLFDFAGYLYANCLSQKWYKESETLIIIINNGLQTKFFNGGLDFKPATWFIVEISNRGYKIDIDLTQFNYPKSMDAYAEALQNWNTDDLKLLDNIVYKLCDFHLKNATHGNQENDADIQFGKSAWFVYAFEILAWLSIREMIGLQNPEKFSHPLMDLELNKLTNESGRFPKNELSELFEKVMERLNPPTASWSVFD